MNRKPNMSGIDRYWKKDEDSRMDLARRMFGGKEFPPDYREQVDRFLDSLMSLVKSRRRTKFVGFGSFEWHPWKNRIPTGRMVETWRLAFKPGRYVKGKYDGR